MNSCRVDKPWIAGACVVGRTGLGVLGSEVPTEDPAGFGAADLDEGDADQELRWLVVRWPDAGTLTVDEYSSFSFDGPPGRYFFDVEAFRAGRSVGIKRVLLLKGEQLTLNQLLQQLLNPLARGGAHYGVNDTSPIVWPYIVYMRVGKPKNVAFKGGGSYLQNSRMQIDIHARTIAEARQIESAVEVAMAAWTLKNTPLQDLDMFEDATQTHRIVKDYSIWAWTP